jgi:hypothetical protein
VTFYRQTFERSARQRHSNTQTIPEIHMKTRTKSVLEVPNDIQQFLDDKAKHLGLGLEVVRRRLDNTAAGICSLSAAQEEAIRADSPQRGRCGSCGSSYGTSTCERSAKSRDSD